MTYSKEGYENLKLAMQARVAILDEVTKWKQE